MSKFDSRFFVHSDEKTDTTLLKLPFDWWSRFYEYEWASKFVNGEDIVLDAACGVCHPFKFYLTDHCRSVYACDLDPRVLNYDAILQDITAFFGSEIAANMDKSYFDKVHLSQANLTALPYVNDQFDKVFCISVLEHMDHSSMFAAFQEFSRVLKDDGLLVLTFDYPDIQFPILEEAITQARLKFYSEVSYELPKDALYSRFHPPTLYCFRAVLRKI
ncbi:class I SAM-dependent methyltransferase [Shimazuella kribbensis]|uniref:class I SAM-dependent methyltransferase n=1 Tax=Shimazuella kribbensis TaxID=139808 RepID=UPI0004022A2F|nr:class I SAM-dependent methyltransferase [Shimazuella kribbensis]